MPMKGKEKKRLEEEALKVVMNGQQRDREVLCDISIRVLGLFGFF